MRHVFILCILCALCVLCGCGKEPTVEGKPRSEWIRLSHDVDRATAEKAMSSLMKLPDDDEAKARVAEMRADGYKSSVELEMEKIADDFKRDSEARMAKARREHDQIMRDIAARKAIIDAEK